MRNSCLKMECLIKKYFDEYKAKTKAEFDEVAKRVSECRYPTKEEIFTKEHVYATPETGGEI